MFCTKCGNQISENDAFCPVCGAPNTAPASEEKAPVATNPFAASEPVSDPFAATTPEATNPFAASEPVSDPFAATTPEATNPFAASEPASNPFAATTPEATNPFAASEPVLASSEKKKGHIWIPIVAVIAAIALLAGIAYVYANIMIPSQQRKALLSTADEVMSGLNTGTISDEDSTFFESDFVLSESDIEEAEDEIISQLESTIGFTASEEFTTSLDGFFRTLVNRMVESYSVDEESYTNDGKNISVDVHVTGINMVALQERYAKEEDLQDMLYDYIDENMERFIEMSDTELAATLGNEFIPHVFDLYTQWINETESTESVWTFNGRIENGKVVLTDIDTHGTLTTESITDIF